MFKLADRTENLLYIEFKDENLSTLRSHMEAIKVNTGHVVNPYILFVRIAKHPEVPNVIEYCNEHYWGGPIDDQIREAILSGAEVSLNGERFYKYYKKIMSAKDPVMELFLFLEKIVKRSQSKS